MTAMRRLMTLIESPTGTDPRLNKVLEATIALEKYSKALGVDTNELVRFIHMLIEDKGASTANRSEEHYVVTRRFNDEKARLHNAPWDKPRYGLTWDDIKTNNNKLTWDDIKNWDTNSRSPRR